MKNLIASKNSFYHIKKEKKGVNENLKLSKRRNGETLEFLNEEGVKKVFKVHHYSNGNTILFKK